MDSALSTEMQLVVMAVIDIRGQTAIGCEGEGVVGVHAFFVPNASYQPPLNPKRSGGLSGRLDGLVRPIFVNSKRPTNRL